MKEISTICVTGSQGYIGAVLTRMLAEEGYTVIGYDTGLYLHEKPLYGEGSTISIRQIAKDVRDVIAADLSGVDAVIHLAALSNDPLGDLQPGITEEINLHGTIRMAEVAKQSGVKRFVFASSQSMYGVADTSREVEEGDPKNPVTTYARTKWEAERALNKLCDEKFTVVSLRPSTVFGASPRLRCDIVFNNLLASGYTGGVIKILSDGSPWRPVVHIQDVCNAFIAGLQAPKGLVSGEAFNVGLDNGNYTVLQLAEAAREVILGCGLEVTGKHGSDSRTYRVSFQKILTQLAGYYRPHWSLAQGGDELVAAFDKGNFGVDDFTGPRFNRLAALKQLMNDGHLDENLRWTKG